MSKIEQSDYSKKGIKIKNFSAVSIIIALTLTVGFVFFAVEGLEAFHNLTYSTEEYIKCEKAAQSLLHGSDELTTDVRLYTMTGKSEYMQAYFEEANVTKSRENAVNQLKEIFPNKKVVNEVELALTKSKELMDREIYAMRLVAEAENVEKIKMPAEVAGVNLTPADRALSKDGKYDKARRMVSDDSYEQLKGQIISNVTESLDDLIDNTKEDHSKAASLFRKLYLEQELGIILLLILVLVNSYIVRKLIVNPLVSYNKSIVDDEHFPIVGALELKALAETYNRVYEENQETQKLIRHEAEHDGLTDLLNRRSFDRVLSVYCGGNSQFALIMLDIDKFKGINDTYGHAMGDAIIQRVANELKSSFRTADFVCRIGGDEFSIVMVNVDENRKDLIADKFTRIARNLEKEVDGLPTVTLSIGIAFSKDNQTADDVYKDADEALYYAKEHGRNRFCFLSEVREKAEAVTTDTPNTTDTTEV